jgi:hypothetical protein
MRPAHVKSRAAVAVTILLLSTASLLVNSCVTTQEAGPEPAPDRLELLAALEQTREITIEENLTYALSRLFGVDNVVVLVSSRAHYGTVEERHGVDASGDETEWRFRRSSGPGEVERVTVAVVINEDALTPEQKANREELREKLSRIVADGAGLLIGDESRDSVSILFMPLAQ